MVYNIDGLKIADKVDTFENDIYYEYKRDGSTNVFYTIIHVPQVNIDGKKQYPFVYYPNYPNGRTESAFEMNLRKKFLIALNAGRFNVTTGIPVGTVIQNSINCSVTPYTMEWDRVLTINNQGELGYAELLDEPATLISNGIVSAITGFIPLILNYKNAEEVDSSISVSAGDVAQRLAICQYNNGDYLIIGAEARGNQSATGSASEGMTLEQVQAICKSYGVKFAFALDGGGSMEMVVGERQLNPFYENVYGRKVPVYIVFNGSTTFPA